MQNQIAVRIDLKLLNAIELERDQSGARARRHHKIIFELPLIAVINQVDAGINILVTDLAKRRHASPPLARIVAQEIIHLGRQLLQPRGLCRRIGTDKLDP